MSINTGKTSARLTDALSATARGFKSGCIGLWQVLLYAYTNFTVVNVIDNEASLIKQINLLHIPLFEFDVNALDGSLAEYFDQKYKKRLLWLSVFFGEQFFACKVH